MRDHAADQPPHPLPQSGGCYVVEAGELRPENEAPAETAEATPPKKPAVKPASKEA